MIRVESYMRTLEQANAQTQSNSESTVDPQSTIINPITSKHTENVPDLPYLAIFITARLVHGTYD